jgi:uncharacterized membrane protein
VGVLALRAKGVRGSGDPFVVPGGPVVPVLAAAVLVALLWTATKQEWEATGITLGLATILYAVSNAMRRRAAAAAPAP